MGSKPRRSNPRHRESNNSRASTARSSRRTPTSTRSKPERGSRFSSVNASFSSFDRSMLRRAIDTTIDGMTRYPKQYMAYFGITSKDSITRSVRSLSRTRDKLGL